jgi:4-alpha-glucanotransferase
LISPDLLVEEDALTEEDIGGAPDFNGESVDYGPVIEYKTRLLRKAFERFQSGAGVKNARRKKEFASFCAKHQSWLDDYSLFVAAKNHFIEERRFAGETLEFIQYQHANEKVLTPGQIKDFYYGAVWNSWPPDLARHDPAAVSSWQNALQKDILFFQFLQYEFFRQWDSLKIYANEAGISIVGDIPIFVAMDSSDVWANTELFQLDANGNPLAVAGVPPDYFSETGQLWGNPLYDWAALKKSRYSWWIRRVQSALSLVDILRIDHFRGFESYWAVPYGEKTAVRGNWVQGPGLPFFKALGKGLGHELKDLPIIAEDLGVVTEEVEALRDASGLPGMKILQFAFSSDAGNDYLPHNFTHTNAVIYTGTHDNDTTKGWYAEAPENEKDYFRRYANASGENAAWDMMRLAYASTAAFAIVPMQDVMNLGGQHRMNRPGQAAGNWRFRYTAEMLKPELAKGLMYLCEIFNR